MEIGTNTLKEPRSSKSMKLKKDQISPMKAKVKDEANKPSIRHDRNTCRSAQDKLISKVSYTNQNLLSRCSEPRGGKIARKRYQYINRDD